MSLIKQIDYKSEIPLEPVSPFYINEINESNPDGGAENFEKKWVLVGFRCFDELIHKSTNPSTKPV